MKPDCYWEIWADEKVHFITHDSVETFQEAVDEFKRYYAVPETGLVVLRVIGGSVDEQRQIDFPASAVDH